MKKEKLWKEYSKRRTREERDTYLASLSDKDFYSMMRMPIGNISRIYLTGFRKVRQNNNLNKYIIHIPHASLEILPEFKEQLIVSYSYFQKENIFISDFKNEYKEYNLSDIKILDYIIWNSRQDEVNENN